MNIMPVSNNPNNPSFGLKYKNVNVDVDRIGKHASITTIRNLATSIVPQMLQNPSRHFTVKLWQEIPILVEPLGIKIKSFDIPTTGKRLSRLKNWFETSETNLFPFMKDPEAGTISDLVTAPTRRERERVEQQQRQEAINALKALLTEPKEIATV